METILLLQFIAHLLADFFFQTEYYCYLKQKHGYLSKAMYIHAAIIFVTSILLTFSLTFVFFAFVISIMHLIIDIGKSEVEKSIKKIWPKTAQNFINPFIFIGDQLLHIGTIYIFVLLYASLFSVPQYVSIFNKEYLLIATGALLCLKPANVFIRILLSSLNLSLDSCNADLERAGRWIGSTERILTFSLVLLGEFTAIGFIIAAKSILRYGDKSLKQTEYVLIGTLLSFGIAIMLGLGIKTGLLLNVVEWLSFTY